MTRALAFLGVALAMVIIFLVIVFGSLRLSDGAENDFREICDATNSTFTEAGGQWLCVRDGEVVYPK